MEPSKYINKCQFTIPHINMVKTIKTDGADLFCVLAGTELPLSLRKILHDGKGG